MLNLLSENYNLDKSEARKRQKEIFRKLNIAPNSLQLNDYEVVLGSEILVPDEIQISFQNVAGLEDEIQELHTLLINSLSNWQKASKESAFLAPPKGVLLYGPPGCGKTMLAKCIAKSCNARFINVDLGSLMDKYFGETEKYLKALFSLARKIRPCIIFIDEIESMLRCRSVQGSHEAIASMKSQLLSYWDGMLSEAAGGVVVMGATNRPHDIDKAFLRRFSLKLAVPLPSEAARRAILAKYFEQAPEFVRFSQMPKILDTLAECTEGYTGSSLEDLVKFTFMQAKEQAENEKAPVLLSTDSFWKNIERFSQWSNIY
jgi:SpoVK/Ycf46/Vps4 family AAA+-type ATPase